LTAAELLSELRAKGIEVSPRDGKLRVNAPSGALTPSLRESITANKQALLDILSSPDLDEIPLERVSRQDALPLSHFQERLWLLQQLDRQGTEYNLVTVWPMGAGVDAARLDSAIRQVLARHEILHTAYRRDGDVLKAVLLQADAVHIDREDLSSLSESEQNAHLDQEVARQTGLPFDLEGGGALRAVVYDLGGRGSAILVAAHHIIVDHWSMSLLKQELQSALDDDAYLSGAAKLQYADYSVWARKVEQTQSMNAALDWWAKYLASPPELCAFDTDMAPSMQGTGASVSFMWDEALSSGLGNFAQSESASVYMCLVAACAAMLNRQTGQEDILIGTAVGARYRPEFETIIGPFVNSIALRLQADPKVSFRALVAQAREAVLETSSRAEVPFEAVIERVQPTRNLSRSLLFQTAVVMQNAWEGQSEAIHGGGAIHDLTWFIRPLEGRFVGSMEYRSDIYSQQTIQGLLIRLEAFLRGAIASPDRPIGEIPVYVGDERQHLIEAFNPPVSEYDHSPVAAQFARMASQHPSRPAVTFAGETFSYGLLNSRVNQVAHRLIDMGIGKGDIVGVCVQRGHGLLESLLGVHRAGAAYLPLDPDFPQGRLEYQLSDSGAKALLAEASFSAKLDLPDGLLTLDLQQDADALAACPDHEPDIEVLPEDISHLIYTSGSTGRPKGVIIRHGSVSNTFSSLRQEPGVGAEDIVAATTTASFDIAGVELLLPLTVGAHIQLLSRDIATDGQALAKALDTCGATIAQATPSAWRMLVEAGWQGGPHIRAITGGEPLTRDLADKLLSRVGSLWNGYGPTETTIYSSGCFILPDGEGISIGKPLSNTRIYVLDANDEIAPVGMRGEICIAGDGVAVGYHDMPAETEAKFRPDHFAAPADGAGLYYRTGDVGRWSSDGRLYHLGRRDHQVKIRGLRIELGEVESILLTSPAIRQAIVIVSEAGEGDQRLVAYVVFEPGNEMTASEVRRLARDRLPNYMVPSVIVELTALPMTPNGKVDRKALPDPYSQAMQRMVRTPPAPGFETDLAAIWKDLLQVQEIGAEDNFFDLGGHSLLTLRVVARVEEMLGLPLDPRLMFFQNLRQIAAQLRRDSEGQG
tara:strand:+ start:3297 stop:6593 length:3297 start_codon:yes stop_codon:yes gene_type:complete